MRLSTRVEDMVKKEAPDIITFQEVFESESDMGLFPGLAEVANNLRFHHHYFSPLYSLQFFGRLAEFGNATVSNLALSDTRTEFTNLEYKHELIFDDDDYNVRNFQHVTVADQNGKIAHIINHHGYHVPGHKKGNDDVDKNQMSFLPSEKPKKQLIKCEGCRTYDLLKHNGRYAKIMDWSTGKPVRFVDLLTEE